MVAGAVVYETWDYVDCIDEQAKRLSSKEVRGRHMDTTERRL